MTASQELVSINMVETMVKHQQTFHKEKKKNTWSSNNKQQLINANQRTFARQIKINKIKTPAK